MTKKDEKKHEEDNFEESALEDELVKLQQELKDAQQKAQENEDRYKRALADYHNLQKRSQEERIEWARSANRDLLLRILVVFDTLVLAYQHSQDQNLQVSIQQFQDVLKAEGVTRIESVGQDFDPNIMEAIGTGEGEEGKVVSEVRAGFMLNDKLLRAAQVTVGEASN